MWGYTFIFVLIPGKPLFVLEGVMCLGQDFWLWFIVPEAASNLDTVQQGTEMLLLCWLLPPGFVALVSMGTTTEKAFWLVWDCSGEPLASTDGSFSHSVTGESFLCCTIILSSNWMTLQWNVLSWFRQWVLAAIAEEVMVLIRKLYVKKNGWEVKLGLDLRLYAIIQEFLQWLF